MTTKLFIFDTFSVTTLNDTLCFSTSPPPSTALFERQKLRFVGAGRGTDSIRTMENRNTNVPRNRRPRAYQRGRGAGGHSPTIVDTGAGQGAVPLFFGGGAMAMDTPATVPSIKERR